MSRHCAMALCVASLLLSGVGIAAAGNADDFQDQGAIGGTVSYGDWIGADGKWLALPATARAACRPNVYANGTMSLLDRGTYVKGSNAYSINSGGAIVGVVPCWHGHAPPLLERLHVDARRDFQLHRQSTRHDLDHMSHAYAISDSNQSGRGAARRRWLPRLLLDRGRRDVDLGALATGQSSYALDIDSATGHVVGTGV